LRWTSSRSRKKVAAASGQITAASLCSVGAELNSIRRWKFASARAGSHFAVSAIDGCTRRSQIPVSSVGADCNRIAPVTVGMRIKIAAAIAGIARRQAPSGLIDGAPNKASSEAASTVTKPSP
jgi:hypothetical protein